MTEEAPSDAALQARFRPRILAELGELDSAREDSAADRRPVELDQQSVGRLSRMDALQGQAMAAAVEARRQRRQSALRAALRRLDEGKFGWCARCGGFIGQARLDTDPAAVICVGCSRPGQ